MTMLATAGSESATNAAPGATPTGEGTGAQATPQNGDVKAGEVNNQAPENQTPDPIEAAVALRLSQESERMKAEAVEEARKTVRTERQEEVKGKAKTSASDDFSELTKKINANAEQPIPIRFTDEDGTERTVNVKLSPEIVQKLFVNDANGFHSTAGERYWDAALTQLEDIATETLPEAAQKAFEAAVEEKDVGTFLERYVEAQLVYSPLAESVITDPATLEQYRKDAKGKSLPQQMKLLGDAIKAHVVFERAKGFSEGKGTPAGEPAAGQGGGGQLTKQAWDAMTTDQRVQAWKDMPDQVRAL